MNIIKALDTPQIFGNAFGKGDYRAWRTFLAACLGLPINPKDKHIFEACTNIDYDPKKKSPKIDEAWVIVGRRGGKSRVAALVAVYLAACRDYSKVLAPREMGTLPVIAQDRNSARTVLGYINGLLDSSPWLTQLITKRGVEAIELATGIRIEIHTASFRALRGYTVIGAVLDEVAFWRSEDAANPDDEVINALRPAM